MKALLYWVLIPALLPVFIILRYVWKLDRYEREPINFVLKAVLFGAIFSLPVAFIERFMIGMLPNYFSVETIEYGLAENVICVGLIEELSKLLAFMFIVWKNPNFDHRYDGIVYGVAVSLGFAGLENILYVFNFGTQVSIGRAIFAIPGHATFGVFMGYYLSRAKHCEIKGNWFGKFFFLIFAIVMPTVIHGVYDFLLSEQARAAEISYWSFICFVLILDFISWRKIKHEFRTDRML